MNRPNISRFISNLYGWRTKRKIIVFESDDWGSIRMPSLNDFYSLKALGVDLESKGYAKYNLYDTLADKTDLESLFEILDSERDMHGKPCVFTAISVVANPNFKKIKENKFQIYSYEPITETLKRYYPSTDVFKTWKEGIEKKIFIPQFHGREHLNVENWMNLLRRGQKDALLCFEKGLWGYVPSEFYHKSVENQAAFQLTDKADLIKQKQILKEGLSLFESLFGYKAKYFVPPNGVFNNSLNIFLLENGIKYRSTNKLQKESVNFNRVRTRINWLGKKDKSGITYITRNCFFEPSEIGKDWVASCLNDIKLAFRQQKPAIISSHRVNYIGSLNEKNRINSLNSLKNLLHTVRKQWPEIEFMSTDVLGDLIIKE